MIEIGGMRDWGKYNGGMRDGSCLLCLHEGQRILKSTKNENGKVDKSASGKTFELCGK